MVEMETIKLKIEGMHCGACVRRVTLALEKLDGVTVEAVEVGSASVAYDTGVVGGAEIAQAVGEIGFKAEIAR